MPDYPMPPQSVIEQMRSGLVIPAHPLALTAKREFDEQRQRALTHYYHAAGAGGVAVGVHTTQFEIRYPQYQLYEPVLRSSAETLRKLDAASGRETVRVAGLYGSTEQAIAEAQMACKHGYHIGLLSLATLQDTDEDGLVTHCQAVAQEIPLMGFYLQPAAGGRLLSQSFWEQFLEIPNVIAIKVAPFNRYQTLDVVRALANVGRAEEIALYTGNDDNIVIDLLTRYHIQTRYGTVQIEFVGGLLGHWAYWTTKAVELLERCRQARDAETIPVDLLTLASQVTDSNAAVFDAAHGYKGVNPGIHEVLRQQGLLSNNLCLDTDEHLSTGQAEEINRVCAAYPHLTDDDFVHNHLHEWLT